MGGQLTHKCFLSLGSVEGGASHDDEISEKSVNLFSLLQQRFFSDVLFVFLFVLFSFTFLLHIYFRKLEKIPHMDMSYFFISFVSTWKTSPLKFSMAEEYTPLLMNYLPQKHLIKDIIDIPEHISLNHFNKPKTMSAFFWKKNWKQLL